MLPLWLLGHLLHGSAEPLLQLPSQPPCHPLCSTRAVLQGPQLLRLLQAVQGLQQLLWGQLAAAASRPGQQLLPPPAVAAPAAVGHHQQSAASRSVQARMHHLLLLLGQVQPLHLSKTGVTRPVRPAKHLASPVPVKPQPLTLAQRTAAQAAAVHLQQQPPSPPRPSPPCCSGQSMAKLPLQLLAAAQCQAQLARTAHVQAASMTATVVVTQEMCRQQGQKQLPATPRAPLPLQHRATSSHASAQLFPQRLSLLLVAPAGQQPLLLPLLVAVAAAAPLS